MVMILSAKSPYQSMVQKMSTAKGKHKVCMDMLSRILYNPADNIDDTVEIEIINPNVDDWVDPNAR